MTFSFWRNKEVMKNVMVTIHDFSIPNDVLQAFKTGGNVSCNSRRNVQTGPTPPPAHSRAEAVCMVKTLHFPKILTR